MNKGIKTTIGKTVRPLEMINPDAATIHEDIDAIAAALVVPSTSGDNFWDDGARSLIGGLIGYVLTNPDGAFYGRDLVEVRQSLDDGKQEVTR